MHCIVNDMLVDVQDIRCVLAVCFTHFWPGRRACLLPLVWVSTRCGFVAQTRGQTFSACGWTSSFSSGYMGTISLTICNVTAPIKAVHRAAFLSYGTQLLHDSANVGWFIVGVCGAPRFSRSEQQVSHCDTSICLRCWNKWVGPLPLVAKSFEQILQWTVVCSRSNATEPNY